MKIRVELTTDQAEEYAGALLKVQGVLRGRKATVSAADSLETLAGKIAGALYLAERYPEQFGHE